MSGTERFFKDLSLLVTGLVFTFFLILLAVRLKEVQIDSAAEYNLLKERQSVRLVQTAAPRGRILDRNGKELATNKKAFAIVLNPEGFQRKRQNDTIEAMIQALTNLSAIVRVPIEIDEELPQMLRRHLRRSQAMPYTVFSDVSDEVLARFFEHSDELAGFDLVERSERVYPCGSLASHIIGYVGRGEAESVVGDEKINFREKELVGRSGIEAYCDGYLRGVSGEKRLTVDARGYTVREREVREAIAGPDLKLTIDANLQQTVESALNGHAGACVVVDASTGEMLAVASAPSYNLNDFVPYLPHGVYSKMTNNAARPLVNRATGGTYAPGSIFKPITALAALAQGVKPSHQTMCDGIFTYGTMIMHCASRWGHGELDMVNAIKVSCNPYFAELGVVVGTNLLRKTAMEFGLGRLSEVDLPVDASGYVPDGQSNEKIGFKWYPGELAQTAIGQGKLLVTPLQMAVMAAGLGTGRLPRPYVNFSNKPNVRKLNIPNYHLEIVREGMRRVVKRGGTGAAAAIDVKADVMGKTGTAEVGPRYNRRKNAWFIAYAKPNAESNKSSLARRSVALAIVLEKADSGGGSAAPRACKILSKIYN